MAKSLNDDDMELNETLVSLLLPIGRVMLKGGLGIGDLVRAAKQAYLRAAIAYVTSAGSRVSASHLSVVTGLTRKEVTAILNEIKGAPVARRGEAKEQRARRVLRGWRLDARFCDNNGAPAKLPLRGDRRSFSALVKLYGGDVTPNSVLKELERLRAVSFSKTRGLRLRSAKVGGKSTEHMTELARLFPDFANTVSPDLPTVGRPLFFGFRDSVVDSSEQAAKFQGTFSNRASAMLQGVQQWLDSQDQTRQMKTDPAGKKLRVGIGVYLVQSPDEIGQSRTKTRGANGDRPPRARAKTHRAP
ncbi:MAG TPA: DUF6502 family protein [Steroidobacteraceae bacterium]|nr:DUF6502 family protein [Steroidobacteraceae bacterium]